MTDDSGYSGVFGSLVLGGYDQSKFTSTNLTIPLGSDVSRDLLVGVQSITTTANTTALTSSSGGFYAFLDSTVAELWLPTSVCSAFEETFGIIYDSTTELYLVNTSLHTTLVDQNANVTFTLGSSTSGGETVAITLPYSAFDLEVSYPITENKTYYFPLKRAANTTQYTLGRTFFQEAYVIADYERRNFTVAPCSWVENAASNIKSIISPTYDLSSDPSSGISAGAIAGIVVGIVAAVAALAGLGFWFWRRRQNTKGQRIAELEARNAVLPGSLSQSGNNGNGNGESPDADDNSVRKPFISGPIGGELGSESEIHEMHAPRWNVEMDGSSREELDAGPDGPGHLEYYGKGGWVASGSGNGSRTGWSGSESGTGTETGTGTWTGTTTTWRSGLSEVDGDRQQIYEMQGSEIAELPDSRRQSWADGDEGGLSTGRSMRGKN